jgi:hypothetical protein
MNAAIEGSRYALNRETQCGINGILPGYCIRLVTEGFSLPF